MTRQQQAEVIAKEVEGLNSLATPEDFIVLGVTYKWCEVAICKDGVNRKVGIYQTETRKPHAMIPEDFIVLGVTYKWCEVAICKDGVSRKVGIFVPEEFVRAKGENTP